MKKYTGFFTKIYAFPVGFSIPKMHSTPESIGLNHFFRIDQVTSELFVAGPRESFVQFSKKLSEIDNEGVLDEIRRIEDIKIFSEDKKIKKVPKNDQHAKLEVVLHASALPSDSYILESFASYSKELKIKPDLKRRRHVGGLCFVPVTAPSSAINDLAINPVTVV